MGYQDSLDMKVLQVEESKLIDKMMTISDLILEKLSSAYKFYEGFSDRPDEFTNNIHKNPHKYIVLKFESELNELGSELLETQVEYLTLFKKQKPTDPFDLYEIKNVQENDPLLPENWLGSIRPTERINNLNKETQLVEAAKKMLKLRHETLKKEIDMVTMTETQYRRIRIVQNSEFVDREKTMETLCDSMVEAVSWMKKNVAIVRNNKTQNPPSVLGTDQDVKMEDYLPNNEDNGRKTSVAQQLRDLCDTLTIPESELGKSYPNFLQ